MELTHFLPATAFHAKSSVPATCGELIQGVINDQHFLVNCPIDLYTEVEVILQKQQGVFIDSGYEKVKAAVQKTFELTDYRGGAIVNVNKPLPMGKGFASSTSEIAAAIDATAKAQGIFFSPENVLNLAATIESGCDGNFLPGINLINPLRGCSVTNLGPSLPLSFIIVDSGGTINTSELDREKEFALCKAFESDIRVGLKKIKYGFRNRIPQYVGEAATESTRLYQNMVFKPEFEVLEKGTKGMGVLGINTAHSGTLLGVMFETNANTAENLYRRVEQLVGAEKIFGIHTLTSGGIL